MYNLLGNALQLPTFVFVDYLKEARYFFILFQISFTEPNKFVGLRYFSNRKTKMFFLKMGLWFFFTMQYVLIVKHCISQNNISITKTMTCVNLSKQYTDVKNILLKKCYENMYCQKTEYDMSCDDDKQILTYSANLSTRFLKKLKKGKGQGEGYFFDAIFWYSCEDNLVSLDVIKEEGRRFTRKKFFLVPNSSHMIIDGPNKNNYIIVACEGTLFLTQINQHQYGRGYGDGMHYEKKFKPISNEDNLITAVMIHATKNTIAYANTKKIDGDIKQNELHIIQNAYVKKSSLWDLIFENNELNKPRVDYHVSVNHEIKKITFFGGNTYMFLTSCGQLGMCWLTKDLYGQPVVEWQIKQHTSFFIDYEPDITTKTKNGYLSFWAFLSNKGEIYVCDFLMPLQKTTLFFVKQADPPAENEQFDRVYFSNQQCGVLYKNTDTTIKSSYTKLIMYE